MRAQKKRKSGGEMMAQKSLIMNVSKPKVLKEQMWVVCLIDTQRISRRSGKYLILK